MKRSFTSLETQSYVKLRHVKHKVTSFALFIFTNTWCSSGQFMANGTMVQMGCDFEGNLKIRILRASPAMMPQRQRWRVSVAGPGQLARTGWVGVASGPGPDTANGTHGGLWRGI